MPHHRQRRFDLGWFAFALLPPFELAVRLDDSRSVLPVQFGIQIPGFESVGPGDCGSVDADTYEQLAMAEVAGVRKLAVWNDLLLITRGELGGLPHYFEARDRNVSTFAKDGQQAQPCITTQVKR